MSNIQRILLKEDLYVKIYGTFCASQNNRIVNFKGKQNIIRKFVGVEIIDAYANSLHCKGVKTENSIALRSQEPPVSVIVLGYGKKEDNFGVENYQA
ncbi:MAG: hypothetical protein ACTS73_04105 [Arsenophonus sp. NEOnobi-MAG3]